MKNLIIALTICLSSIASQAANTCGALEIGKAMATIDMELDLLRSGLYEVVRNESMVYITNIVKSHLESATVCDAQSVNLKSRALETINTLVIYNSDTRPYSINTATRIFMTFKNDVSVLEDSAANHLDRMLRR